MIVYFEFSEMVCSTFELPRFGFYDIGTDVKAVELMYMMLHREMNLADNVYWINGNRKCFYKNRLGMETEEKINTKQLTEIILKSKSMK